MDPKLDEGTVTRHWDPVNWVRVRILRSSSCGEGCAGRYALCGRAGCRSHPKRDCADRACSECDRHSALACSRDQIAVPTMPIIQADAILWHALLSIGYGCVGAERLPRKQHGLAAGGLSLPRRFRRQRGPSPPGGYPLPTSVMKEVPSYPRNRLTITLLIVILLIILVGTRQ